VLQACAALCWPDGTTKSAMSNTACCENVPVMVHVPCVKFVAFAMVRTRFTMSPYGERS